MKLSKKNINVLKNKKEIGKLIGVLYGEYIFEVEELVNSGYFGAAEG